MGRSLGRGQVALQGHTGVQGRQDVHHGHKAMPPLGHSRLAARQLARPERRRRRTRGAPVPAPTRHDEGGRLTRLDLARWLTSPDNPLTARVFMNRLWKQFFGTGISSLVEDVGAQGEWPVHPELLDWLALEFRDGGWNVKRMVKLLVMSASLSPGLAAATRAARRRSRQPPAVFAVAAAARGRVCARQLRWRSRA